MGGSTDRCLVCGEKIDFVWPHKVLDQFGGYTYHPGVGTDYTGETDEATASN